LGFGFRGQCPSILFPAALDRPTTIAARDRGDRGARGAEGQKGKGDRSDRAASEVDPDAATFLKTRLWQGRSRVFPFTGLANYEL